MRSEFKHGTSLHGSEQLLADLVHGCPGLPSARERWVALLTHRSATVRLEAEIALMRLVRGLPPERAGSTAGRSDNLPHRVPQLGITHPKRHCIWCFGHDFWVDARGHLHCERCDSMPTA